MFTSQIKSMIDSTPLDFSTTESEILQLKIGRCNTDNFDENILLNKIIEGKYDVVRLKLPAEDEEVSNKLNNINLPFYFSGSIRRYKTKISKKPEGDYINKSLLFEKYDGSQDAIFDDLLDDTWGSYPIGYYRTPILKELVNKKQELKSVCTFYKKQNFNLSDSLNTMMFMKDKGAYVGFFALNFVGNHLESHIGGIKKVFQKDGYFLDMLRYIKNFCIDNNLEHFVFGARNENALVQSIFHKVGFIPVGTENVFHITPFLDGEESNIEINESEFSFEFLLEILKLNFNNHQIIKINTFNLSGNFSYVKMVKKHLKNGQLFVNFLIPNGNQLFCPTAYVILQVK